MSGGMRQILNLGLYDGLKRAYSLRRLNLSKMKFFHPTAEEAAAHGKVLPTLALDKARATNRKRICNTKLATAEAAAPKMDMPKSDLVMGPPQISPCLHSRRFVHFFPTASESKVILGDRGNRMLRFNIVDGSRYMDTLPCLHGVKEMPMVISVPPTDVHLPDGEDTGDLYIIDGLLHPDKAEVRPQFEALVWRGFPKSAVSSRFWHCDILPLPPWISHHKHGMVFGHALVDNSICFSTCGAEGAGTYCFHIATREWSKAGDWLMPFNGKADYVPELGLWFGITQDNRPCAADLSGLVRGEELSPDKMRIWERDDLPEEWQPKSLHNSCAVSLGSGRFIIVDFLDVMKFDKEWNEMSPVKEFALFTGMELAFSNSKGKNGRNGASKDNGHHSSGTDCSGNESCNCSVSGNENGGKGKGVMRGLRVIKHKSRRYMFKKQLRIEAVL
ncbi:uncharacterized protein LOC125540411 [Triticum urartu]|uniref:uncharacterized protein LOC125524289 n=1 Tax=Triticum urartu TaxID=4572 RepID=UPI0020443F45|nr:uncharacterized protein LOC125524289 [Triticum urartu]XP_048559982.1 uncharacterized protein LOC125540411 [Triticum urartu]